MQCKQKLDKCLCIRSYFWGGFSCHVERTYGGGLRYLGWQLQATVRHMPQAIKNKPAPAYLWNAYMSSAKTMWSRSETIPAEPCPNCWPAELGANKWLLFQTIKNYLTPSMSFHIPVSQNRDMGLMSKAQVCGRRQGLEDTSRTERRRILSDQDRSNSGWQASHLWSLWLSNDQ